MRLRHMAPLAILLAIGVPAAFAQPAGGGAAAQAPNSQMTNQRFEEMGKIMSEAQNAQGAQRAELMNRHMQLMQNQMQEMHSMMGGGMMGGGMMGGQAGANGMMGCQTPCQSGANGAMGGGMMRGSMTKGGMMGRGPQRFAQMQTRMDMLQRMMEQMLDQMKLMMAGAPAK